MIKHRTFKILQTAGPWILTIFIFYYLFKQYPPASLADSFNLVNLGFFIGWAVIYFLLIWLIDCWGYAKILTRCGHPTTASALLVPRSVSYLLMVLNYGAGQGSFGYVVSKTRKIPMDRSMGLCILVLMFDLYWVILLATLGSFVIRFDAAGFDPAWLARGLGIIATIAFILGHFFWKWETNCRWIRWIHSQPVFGIFRSSTWRDHLVLLSYRLPMHLTICSGLYVVALTFHAHIPWLAALAGLPLILLVGVLPITPGGLGTTQLVTVALFKNYLKMPPDAILSASELLFSMSLLWLFANYFLKALWGALCLHSYTRQTKEKLSTLTHRVPHERGPFPVA